MFPSSPSELWWYMELEFLFDLFCSLCPDQADVLLADVLLYYWPAFSSWLSQCKPKSLWLCLDQSLHGEAVMQEKKETRTQNLGLCEQWWEAANVFIAPLFVNNLVTPTLKQPNKSLLQTSEQL